MKEQKKHLRKTMKNIIREVEARLKTLNLEEGQQMIQQKLELLMALFYHKIDTINYQWFLI